MPTYREYQSRLDKQRRDFRDKERAEIVNEVERGLADECAVGGWKAGVRIRRVMPGTDLSWMRGPHGNV